MIVRSWSEISNEEMSEESIRKKFDYQRGYRFYPNTYEKGLSMDTLIGWNVRMYVVDGVCTCKQAGQIWEVARGQFIDLVPGDYVFDTSSSPVHLMRVAYLPQLATI